MTRLFLPRRGLLGLGLFFATLSVGLFDAAPAEAAGPRTMSAAELLAGEPAAPDSTTSAVALSAVSTTTTAPSRLTSFGTELVGFGSKVVLTGYADMTLDLTPGKPLTFDQGHANPIIGAHLGPNLYGEIELEFEHGGDASLVEYAYVDWRPLPSVALRAGKFMVPVGYFNENLHPSFRNPLVSRPLLTRKVLPSTWSDTGIQIRLDVPISETLDMQLRLFTGNGLEEQPGDISGDVRALRHNSLDRNAGGKALGGRLGIERHHSTVRLRLGVSAYHAAVSTDGTRTLQIAALDVALRVGALRLVGEFAALRWRRQSGVARRLGGYGEATWFFSRRWQLIGRVGFVDEEDLDRHTNRVVGGVRWVVTPLLRLFLELGAEGENGVYGPAARTMTAFSF